MAPTSDEGGLCKAAPSKGTATRYVITDIGRIAFDDTLG